VHHLPRILRDGRAAARFAELHYADPCAPGLRRRRRGKGFVYIDAQGRPIRDRRLLARIRALAIPPAWTDVWICPRSDGHVQATGRDARGRKQYRYHPGWRKLRDAAKYYNIVSFGRALPRLRARVERDLSSRGLGRDKLCAIAVRILDETSIRVGNEAYTRDNRSFGLTTLRDGHARLSGDRVALDFVGKGGRRRRLTLRDRRVVAHVRRCRDLPGQRLLQYYDERGNVRALGSGDVNRYLAEATGKPFTAKEFRTWNASVGAALLLAATHPPASAAAGRRGVNTALRRLAEGLGNTVAICKKCYVHPTITDAFLAGQLHDQIHAAFHGRREVRGLRPDEAAVLAFLEQRLSPPAALAA
jgi:DNA topoisomerase I